MRIRRKRSSSVHVHSAIAASAMYFPADDYSPFYGVDKGSVLQEARVFNDREIDPKRCAQVRCLSRFVNPGLEPGAFMSSFSLMARDPYILWLPGSRRDSLKLCR